MRLKRYKNAPRMFNEETNFGIGLMNYTTYVFYYDGNANYIKKHCNNYDRLFMYFL